jgi:hypothetical protein
MDASQITINVWPAGSAPAPAQAAEGAGSTTTLEDAGAGAAAASSPAGFGAMSSMSTVAADEEETLPEPEEPAVEVPWTYVDAFQDVPAEESRNSFVKQFGRFTIHDDEHGEVERLWGSTGRAYALTTGEGKVTFGGHTSYGATVHADIQAYLRRNPAQRIFSIEQGFAVLVPVGESNRLIVWGPSINTTLIRYPLTGIRSVYANRYAFAFIYETPLSSGARAGQRIGAFGADANGGLIPDDIHLKLANDPPVSIRATEAAFAVLTASGKVHAWGNASYGGSMSTAAITALAGAKVRKLFAALCAFCAIRDDDGAPVTWGNATYGGNIPSTAVDSILDDGGAETVVASQLAFCCITSGRKKAVSWGEPSYGGSMNAAAASIAALGGIVACRAASWAFCMINTKGQLAVWGHGSHGGVPPAVTSVGLQSGPVTGIQAAEPGTGDVVQEYADTSASNTEPSASAAGPIGWTYEGSDWKAYICAVDSGFCIITTYPDDRVRSVTSWGAADTLISDATKQVLLASYLEAVKTSNRAYLAVVREGEATGTPVAWGETGSNGGLVPEDLRQKLQGPVVDARSITNVPAINATTNASGFVVWTAAGQVAMWGGGTGAAFMEA